MRKVKKVMLLIVVFMIAVSIKGNTASAKYVIQSVPDKAAWTSINVSDAYDACQDLNTDASSLGHTENLKAHLITNADWYAVSLLTYSAYGDREKYRNGGSFNGSTTGNKTGVMKFGYNSTFTSSVMEGSTTNLNRTSLHNNIGTLYVESVKNKTNRILNEQGRGLLENEILSGSFGTIYYNTKTAYPVIVRSRLFGFSLGEEGYYGYSDDGAAHSSVTFRPVIWNK